MQESSYLEQLTKCSEVVIFAECTYRVAATWRFTALAMSSWYGSPAGIAHGALMTEGLASEASSSTQEPPGLLPLTTRL